MKVKQESFTTKHHVVEFDNADTEDVLIIKIDKKMLGIRASLPYNRLEFFPVSEGSKLDNEPVLTINRSEWEDITQRITYPIQFISITYPKELHQKVKERLKDLPIMLANIGDSERTRHSHEER